MRPKKVVLLYCDNADLHSEINYLLYLRGYNVFATQDLALACRALMDDSIVLHCMVVQMGRGQALEGLAGIRPDLPLIWMAPSSEVGQPNPNSVHAMIGVACHWADPLLSAVAVASMRKRGPGTIMSAFLRLKEVALVSQL